MRTLPEYVNAVTSSLGYWEFTLEFWKLPARTRRYLVYRHVFRETGDRKLAHREAKRVYHTRYAPKSFATAVIAGYRGNVR